VNLLRALRGKFHAQWASVFETGERIAVNCQYGEKRLRVSKRFNSGKLLQMDRVGSCVIRLMQVIAKTFQEVWLRGLLHRSLP
jgi:hypothetical protein